MLELVIKDANSDASLQFGGETRRGLTEYDKCYFSINFSSISLRANLRAYDISPDRWSEYFADLAANWRGWTGVKDLESLEGHMRLEATSDVSGHVRLFIRLRCRYAQDGGGWLVETSIALDAGQLEDLAGRAKAYFG